MIIGSHNSWSYLPPKKWWMKLIAFTAKCQSVNIRDQYEIYGVRCFDLRVLANSETVEVAHGIIKYDINYPKLVSDIAWLNEKGDCYIRLIHEIRKKSQYTNDAIEYFRELCASWKEHYPNIKWWCGRNLYNWEFDYDFGPEYSCSESYASVSFPKLIDDWWPWSYAYRNNKKIREKGTDKDILLIDFVNYGN